MLTTTATSTTVHQFIHCTSCYTMASMQCKQKQPVINSNATVLHPSNRARIRISDMQFACTNTVALL